MSRSFGTWSSGWSARTNLAHPRQAMCAMCPIPTLLMLRRGMTSQGEWRRWDMSPAGPSTARTPMRRDTRDAG
jgi:hypothetical protein